MPSAAFVPTGARQKSLFMLFRGNGLRKSIETW